MQSYFHQQESKLADPLAEVVGLLQPNASFSKVVSARGPWRVRRADEGRPFYCAVLEGACRIEVDGSAPLRVEKGDFVLIPSAFDFVASSLQPPPAKFVSKHVVRADGSIRHGEPKGPADVRMVVGYCAFASPDASLLVSLLPQVIHVHGERRLATLVELVREESKEQRPARDVVLRHLVEVLLIEALRSSSSTHALPGLVRGLADERLAVAIRAMHEHPAKAWTVAHLAKKAALSRSMFFERFRDAVGTAPMEYLLGWRMALAKKLLRGRDLSVAEVAERVGYGSASTFSVAFTRQVGTPPSRFAKES